MRIVRILLIILSSFTLVSAQAAVDWKWRDFHSSEARIQAIVPCDLVKTVKSFQDKPRPIKVHGFNCEIRGIRFLISVRDHMDTFNPYTIENAFEAHEFILKNIFGDVEKAVLWAGSTSEGFLFHDYNVRLKDGGRVRSHIVVNEFATYEALVGMTKDDLEVVTEKKLDFDAIADRYLKSIQITE